jgi:hypothetical protein
MWVWTTRSAFLQKYNMHFWKLFEKQRLCFPFYMSLNYFM